jgi:hypothetical protein
MYVCIYIHDNSADAAIIMDTIIPSKGIHTT